MKVEKDITIINRLGLHARACAKLVKAAAQMMVDPTPPEKSFKRGKSVVVGGTHTREFETDDM